MNREKPLYFMRERLYLSMIRVYREDSGTEQDKKVHEPRLSKKGEKQPITASTDSLDYFTADDIISLMTAVDELKDMLVQAINCGDGLWEFLVGDNVYRIDTGLI